MLQAMDKSVRNNDEMTARKLKAYFHERFVAAHEVMCFGEHLKSRMTTVK